MRRQGRRAASAACWKPGFSRRSGIWNFLTRWKRRGNCSGRTSRQLRRKGCGGKLLPGRGRPAWICWCSSRRVISPWKRRGRKRSAWKIRGRMPGSGNRTCSSSLRHGSRKSRGRKIQRRRYRKKEEEKTNYRLLLTNCRRMKTFLPTGTKCFSPWTR